MIRPDLNPSSVLTNSAVPNQQRRGNDAKTTPSLPFLREAVKENEPERMPPPPSAKGWSPNESYMYFKVLVHHVFIC